MARKSRKNPTPEVAPAIDRKTAIYLRLSREDLQKKGDSLENQKKICQQHLLSLPELGTAVIYEDNGFTGHNSDRPEFQKLLTDVEKGLIEAIIVKDLSRLGRNSLQTGYYLDRVFPLNEVRFIAVTDNYDSLTDQGDILIPIKNMLNEAHAIDIGKKIQASKQQTIAKGGFVGRMPPYGYKKQDGNCQQLEVDEVSSKVVVEIYQLLLDEYSLSAISRHLNERKELSPTDYDNARKGKKIDPEHQTNWGNSAVKRILTSEVYIGHMKKGMHVNVNRVTVKNDPDKITFTKNTHEAIISEEMFQKVQECLSARCFSLDGRSDFPILFSRKIVCGICGNFIYRRIKKRKNDMYNIYRCNIANKFGASFCSGETKHSFKEPELQKILSVTLNKQAEILLGKQLLLVKKEIELESVKLECKQKQKIQEQKITKTQKYLKSLYENFVSEVISPDDYKELKAQYEEEVKSAKAEYLAITEKADTLVQEIKFLTELSTELSNPELVITKEIVDKTVDKITVFSKERIEIKFAFNFPLIDEVIENGQ